MNPFPVFGVANGACACPAGAACKQPGKHPLVKWQEPGEYDPADWPGANWAVATGNGVVVLDLDRKPGKDGLASLRALGTVPRTRTVRTGSGGLHLYFRGEAANSAGKIAPGIDVRGTGGYVLIPPSNHVSGGRYELIADLPLAEFPSWLQLTAPAPAAVPAGDRGYFPKANAEVLDGARAALERHGPAIEGQGGDEHTFRACALLVHDWALSDDEAWPLLEEWNSSCQPPWDEDDLRAKLAGGAKYGTHDYGGERALDSVETARKLIRDWDRDEAKMYALIGRVRPVVLNCGDPARRATIERELAAATGLKARELALPRPRPRVEKGNGIEVTARLAEVADRATQVIRPLVFARNGVLCEVVTNERTYIHELTAAGIQDKMSRATKWFRTDDKGMTAQAAPLPVATILHDRRRHEHVRVIEAVTQAPIFLADGSILRDEGYNPEARVYLDPSVTVDVADQPTRDDARAAVALLSDLLSDFQFQERADFAAWVAALLSPLVKAATGNACTPLICVSASTPGAGKSLLTDVLARIVTGQAAEVRPYNPKDPSEWGKRLTAFVRMASPINVFDNCNGHFGDDALNRLITSQTWSDRVLGVSEAPPVPVVGVWFANGNNIEPEQDTIRRCLMVRIKVDRERPQERGNFEKPLLIEHTLEHRGELLSAALTMLRAWHVAGRPGMNLPSWGSFTTWSGIVRNAVVWAGLPDPFITQQRMQRECSEPDNDAHDFWIDAISNSDGTTSGIATVANQRDARGILGAQHDLTPHAVRRFVARFVDRPRQGRRIRRESGRYWVE